ncbi:tetratricopeptide repeat-containing sensor histidine kinase [Pedobacter sp. GSP4]|uniref:tetratricopeptide repeat-containing sensor histidine kinase n=1 Tax=Pedobacter sp. GSP4 TaxID=3453716 RepID=UPI003EE8DDA9
MNMYCRTIKPYINIIFLFLLLFSHVTLRAEPMYVPISIAEAQSLTKQIRLAPENTRKVDMLLDLAYFHMEKEFHSDRRLDSASILLARAGQLANRLFYPKGIVTTKVLMGLCNTYQGKDEQAMGLYKQVIASAARFKLFELEGRAWHLIGLQQDVKTRVLSFKKAIACYQKVKDYGRIGHLQNRILFTGNYAAVGRYFPGYFPISPAFIPAVKKELSGKITQEKKIDLLLKLASIYIYRSGQQDAHLDSAIALLSLAGQLSEKTGNRQGYNEALLLKTSAYREKGKMPEVYKILKKLTDTSKTKLLMNFANHYYNIASLNTGEDRKLYLDSCMIYYKLALQQSIAIKNMKYAREVMKKTIEVLDALTGFGNINPQEHYALVSKNAPIIGFPSKARLYSIYASYYNNTGNFYKALYYTQLMEQNLKPDLDHDDKYWVYYTLVAIYKNKNDLKKTNEYYLKIIDLASSSYNTIIIYSYVNAYIKQLILLNQPLKAQQYLKEIVKKIPFRNDADNLYYHVAMGNYYKSLNNFQEAEKSYKLALRYAGANWDREPKFELADLYARYGKFKLANQTLIPHGAVPMYKLNKTNLKFLDLQARIDSGLGSFNTAYPKLSAVRKLNDSIYAVSKDRHTQELEFQYRTQINQAELHAKDLNIQLLKKNAALLTQSAKTQEIQLRQAGLLVQKKQADLKLKEKNIALLNESTRLQESILQKQGFERQVAIGAAVLLTLVSVLFWRLYHLKRVSNAQLHLQQQNIEASYGKLQNVLKEKDWLLKEIHHRVKNNLHMVMSLLESQSAYLQEDALDAIQKSQHRIYAMSLIHQKLYLSDDVKTIKVSHYITELIEYLKDSFEVKRIDICLDIDDVEIEVATAVPLGLILNEAVTNSIKYAFDKDEKGKIDIALKVSDRSFELRMADNGKGLPKGFQFDKASSLGMKLIKGLSGQLEGRLSIESGGGTKICISSIPLDYQQRLNLDKEYEHTGSENGLQAL